MKEEKQAMFPFASVLKKSIGMEIDDDLQDKNNKVRDSISMAREEARKEDGISGFLSNYTVPTSIATGMVGSIIGKSMVGTGARAIGATPKRYVDMDAGKIMQNAVHSGALGGIGGAGGIAGSVPIILRNNNEKAIAKRIAISNGAGPEDLLEIDRIYKNRNKEAILYSTGISMATGSALSAAGSAYIDSEINKIKGA